MKTSKLIIIAASLIISSGCTKTVSGINIPELKSELGTKAKPLDKLTDGKFGTIVKDSGYVSAKYNEVANQLNSLIDYFNQMRDTVNESNKK